MYCQKTKKYNESAGDCFRAARIVAKKLKKMTGIIPQGKPCTRALKRTAAASGGVFTRLD